DEVLGEGEPAGEILQVAGRGHHHGVADAVVDQRHRHLLRDHLVAQLDAGGDVQAGTALDADRLQGNLLVRAAQQHVGADARTDRGARGRAAVVARQGALGDRAWSEHQPDDLRFLGEAEIDAVLVDGADIALTHPVGPHEQAVEILGGTEHEAHAAGDPALQRADVDPGLAGLGQSGGRQDRNGNAQDRRNKTAHSSLLLPEIWRLDSTIPRRGTSRRILHYRWGRRQAMSRAGWQAGTGGWRANHAIWRA